MQRNTRLVIGLMLALGLALGWALLGPEREGAELVSAAETAAEPSAPVAPLGPLDALKPEGPPREAGRAVVEVPKTAPAIEETEELVDPSETGLLGRTVDQGGKPLGGVRLELWATSKHVWDPRLEPKLSLSAHVEAASGPDGRFKLTGLPGFGTYLYLVAEAPGRAPAELFAFEARPGHLRDLGDLRLAPPVTLIGVVLDERDVPLGGAELWLSRGTVGSSRVRAVAQPAGFADSTGRFQLGGLTAGNYVVAARAPEHAMTFSETLRIDPGGLPPGEVSLRLASAYTLRGRVVDGESGTGLSGATLRVMPSSMSNAQYFDLEVDATGGFEFPGLSKGGRLQVTARRDGYLTATSTLRPSSTTAGQLEERVPLYPRRELVVTVLDDATDAPVPGAAIFPTGNNPSTLRTPAKAGFAAAPGAAPLATTNSAGVARLPLDRSEPWLTVLADGYAPKTESSVPRTPRNPATAEDQTLEVRLGRGAAALVTITAGGEPVQGARVELRIASSEPGTGPGSQPANTKQLFSSNSRSSGLRSRRVGADLLWRDEANLSPVARTQTDAKGEALFSLLPEGLYFVNVRAGADLEAGLYGPLAIFSDSVRVELPVELLPAAALFGRVMSASGPAPGQRVLAIRSLDQKPMAEGRRLPKIADQASTTTDETGSFRLEGLAPGTWKVVSFQPLSLMDVRAPVHSPAALGYQLQVRSQMIELGAGDQREVELEAQTSGTHLAGRVLINHEPRAGVTISGSFRDSEGNRQSFNATTDSTGRYETDGLLPGRWQLMARMRPMSEGGRRVYAASVAVARHTLEIADEPEQRFDVDIEVGGLTLEVKLIDPPVTEGEEAPELETPSWLSITLAADPTEGGVAGLPDGPVTNAWLVIGSELVLGNLPAGAYKLALRGMGAKNAEAKLRINAGSETKATVEVERLPKGSEPDYSGLYQGYL